MAREGFRFREQHIRVAAAANDEVIFAPRRERAFTEITRWSVEDRDHAATSVRTVVRGRGGVDIPENEQKTVAGATLYWDDQGTFLDDNESLVAAFAGATAGDHLVLNVEGFYRPLDEEGG